MPHFRSPRIWGTFSVAGGVGATTLTFHLARLAAKNGARTLVVESSHYAPLREILESQPPFWEDYRVGSAIANEAMPRLTRAGFALLTRRLQSALSPELFHFVIDQVKESFDLILIDNPTERFPSAETLFIAENSLPSLIGLHTLSQMYKPQILIVNKFTPRIKKKGAIESFVLDAQTFHIPSSADLALALGFAITHKLAKRNEKALSAILGEMLS